MLKAYLRKIRYSLVVISRILGRGEFEKCCPCCGYLGRFDTMGHPPRYGSVCPLCGSMERHRLLILADQTENFFSGKKVLHFAPEAVIYQIIRTRAKKYVTADSEPGIADFVMNIESIEQPDESWDIVICSHVLEHVNDQLALSELYRILRKGAILVAMVPLIEGWEKTYENPSITKLQEKQLHFGQRDHIRYYGRDFRDRLKHVGFSIREYTAYGSDVVKYGLLRGEKIFICTKQN